MAGMEWLAARLAEVPGVVAVTLGGSRASGRHRPESDWDFGLYYREVRVRDHRGSRGPPAWSEGVGA
jgi:predicted nucleotidyltransferase